MQVSQSSFQIPTATALSRRYTFWLLMYAIVFLSLWILGVESLYEHPTPFYALFRANFGNRASFFALLALVCCAFWITRKIVFPNDVKRGISKAFIFSVGFCVVAVVLSVTSKSYSIVELIGGAWTVLRFHLLAILVFVSGFGLLFTLFAQYGWPNRDLTIAGTRAFLLGLVIFAALFASAIAMTRGGLNGISQAYERQSYEYISDIGKGLTIRGLFRDYAEMHSYLSMHAKVHPPGPIAVLWILSYIAGREPLGLSIATIVFGSLAVIPLFYLARDIAGEQFAVVTSLIYAVMPTIVLFTATSADILFMPFTMATLFLFWRAIHRRSILYALAAGVAYALCSLLSFSLIGLGSFFAFVGLWRLATSEYRNAVVMTACCMTVGVAAVHGAVWLWSGFDVVQCFQLSKAQFDTDQVELDKITPRYNSLMFKIINPMCWVYFAGIPATVLFVANLFRPQPGTRSLMIVLTLTLISLNFLYLARGEGERSAMYIMPFVAIGAGLRLSAYTGPGRNNTALAATVAFLAFQCWLTETIFYTYW